jgi:hypothetical protein
MIVHVKWKVYSRSHDLSSASMSGITLVENMVKKNRSCFPIAVLLTTLIRSHETSVDLFFWFYDYNFDIFGAFHIPLDRS